MAGLQPGYVPQTNSRKRPPPTGDEEATTRLKLGDMEEAESLSVAEVHSLLKRLEESGTLRANSTEIFLKTREYCEAFARFKDPASVEQVYKLSLSLIDANPAITKFERAQLGE